MGGSGSSSGKGGSSGGASTNIGEQVRYLEARKYITVYSEGKSEKIDKLSIENTVKQLGFTEKGNVVTHNTVHRSNRGNTFVVSYSAAKGSNSARVTSVRRYRT